MRPFETLGSVTTSEGRRLTLHRRDGDYFINLDGDELMSTRAPGSERALAELACGNLATRRSPRVLVGGLGLGFTVRAALEVLPEGAEVVVAELFPAVVTWNREHLGELHRRTVEEHRVEVREQDVWSLLGGQLRFDAILLDVDNGPDAWCLDSNRRLYDRRGLERIKRSLRREGVLAVWSAHPDPAFVKKLTRGGFAVQVETVRSRGRKGNRHTIFLARLGARAAVSRGSKP